MNRWHLAGLVLGVLLMVPLLVVGSLRHALANQLPPAWRIGLSAWWYGVRVDHGIEIIMPDGVRLAASLYLPRDVRTPVATVLVRLPYHRLRYGEGFSAGLFFARHGYAVLVEDLRGTGDSQGELLPWEHAAGDGVATLDWIVRQSWSSGKVGTFGCSALGETQLVLAARNHPAHAAMIPSGAGGAVGSAAGRYSYFGVFEGGVFELASGFGWFAGSGTRDPNAPRAQPFEYPGVLRELPVSSLVAKVRPTPNAYTDFLATPLGDSRWDSWGYLSDADHSHVPALVINTWGDQTVGDALALAEAWRVSGAPQKVVIAPGNHCEHEEAGTTSNRFGELHIADAARPWKEWYLKWFDRWLRGRGDGLAELSAYTYFMLVENRWLSADQWPPAEASLKRWYLASAGHANSRRGDGRLAEQPPIETAADEFSYDPANPAPSRGGPVCCTGNPADKPGPADQAVVEARDDVLVYTSASLAQDLRIAGPIRARLTVSSSASDTDLVLRLVHVWPDGQATSIQEGALRLRYRDGVTRPRLLTPAERVQVTVDIRSIAYKLPRGHQLRLQVTSSSFPRLERNLNTGAANNADETHMVVAVNRIYHGPETESYVETYVLPTTGD